MSWKTSQIVTKEKMEIYRKAALFSVKSAKFSCTYTGWVYTGLFYLPHKLWSRVVYDKIQDLVSEGTESQKNLLQLSRTAQHVWLLSTTPWPHGILSINCRILLISVPQYVLFASFLSIIHSHIFAPLALLKPITSCLVFAAYGLKFLPHWKYSLPLTCLNASNAKSTGTFDCLNTWQIKP